MSITNFLKEGEHLSWRIDNGDTLIILVVDNSLTKEVPIAKIWIGSIIEASSRKAVVNHVKACDNTPWLANWQKEKYGELIDELTS